MGKYLNRPALTSQQEAEIFPLLDAALQLPFGKALVHQCSTSRARYLSRILNGERYRNAIQSISMYTPEEPLYGRGLYYHLVIEPFTKGLLVAHVEIPPTSLTWHIIECAAARQAVDVSAYTTVTVNARLNKLRERHEEIRGIYLDGTHLKHATPSVEELIVVDVDTGTGKIPAPSPEQRAKLK